jgi:hypothetical protein
MSDSDEWREILAPGISPWVSDKELARRIAERLQMLETDVQRLAVKCGEVTPPEPEAETELRELTRNDAHQALSGLYDRKFETQRYIDGERTFIREHETHGEVCCQAWRLDSRRENLRMFEERMAAVESAISKLEAIADGT